MPKKVSTKTASKTKKVSKKATKTASKNASRNIFTAIIASIALVIGGCFGAFCDHQIVTADESVKIGTPSDSATDQVLKDQMSYIVADANGNTKKTFNLDHGSPVALRLSYLLDGQIISPSELPGKSGHITFRFEYESMNNAPFAVISGTILDNEKFSNVKVDHGKVIDDGASTVAMGVAVTGINQNLPKSVEISADVKDFQLEVTYTLVTNEVFDMIDGTTLNNVDDLVSQVSTAMDKILDGSHQLTDGLGQLSSKTDLLVDGINQVNNGLNTLSANSSLLDGGAETIFNKFISVINSAKNVVENVVDILELPIDLPYAGIPLSISNYDNWFNEVIVKLNAAKSDCSTNICRETIAKVVNFVNSIKSELNQYHTFYQGILDYTSGVDQAAAGLSQISANLPALQQGTKDLYNGAATLESGLSEFNTEAVQKITSIANELTSSVRNAQSFSKFKILIKTAAI